MNLFSLFPWFRPKAEAEPPAAPAVQRGIARPTYATVLTGQAILPRPQSYELLGQFYRAIPVMGRAIDILSNFVGCPCFTSENEALADDLNRWARNVQYGAIGRGLHAWLRDHLEQTLLYGFGVGEFIPAAQRNEVVRLWSYKSPAFTFETDDAGELRILQQGWGQRIILDPLVTVHSSHNPEGCDPHGKSLFFSSHTFCQAWLDIAHAFRATWRRSGIPTYHVHYEAPETTETATLSQARTDIAANWNAAMKSQVVDGIAEDFYSAAPGPVTVSIIGADGAVIDITISKRAVVEEVVAASGIPAWLLGYSWSTTERLSTQQADMLLAMVDCLRMAAEPCIEKIAMARQKLAGKKGEWAIHWSDINLQDQKDTSQAALQDANAMVSREKVGMSLWRSGVFNQERYAELVTGSPEVAMMMAEPPALLTPAPRVPTTEEDSRMVKNGRAH